MYGVWGKIEDESLKWIWSFAERVDDAPNLDLPSFTTEIISTLYVPAIHIVLDLDVLPVYTIFVVV